MKSLFISSQKFFSKEWVRVVLYFVLLIAVFLLTIRVLDYFNLGIEELRALTQRFGIWGSLILVAATTASLVFSPLSSSSIIALGVVLYGPIVGYCIGFVSGMLGGLIDYTLAYRYGQRFIGRFVGPKTLLQIQTQGERVKLKGFWALLALTPLSLDLVSYAAGLVQFNTSKFVLALIFGVMVNTLVVVLLAAGVIQFI